MSKPLKLPPLNPKTLDNLDIEQRYKEFAPVYNSKIEEWGYQGYQIGAELLNKYVSQESSILDVGCGTGLVGKSLEGMGFNKVIGVDISEDMLKECGKTNAYTDLYKEDFSQPPTRFENNHFQAAICIGVLSLISELKVVPMLLEFIRVVGPMGYLIFTQNEALIKEFKYIAILKDLEDRGLVKPVLITEPQNWLPSRKGYENQRAVYFVYQVQ